MQSPGGDHLSGLYYGADRTRAAAGTQPVRRKLECSAARDHTGAAVENSKTVQSADSFESVNVRAPGVGTSR